MLIINMVSYFIFTVIIFLFIFVLYILIYYFVNYSTVVAYYLPWASVPSPPASLGSLLFTRIHNFPKCCGVSYPLSISLPHSSLLIPSIVPRNSTSLPVFFFPRLFSNSFYSSPNIVAVHHLHCHRT